MSMILTDCRLTKKCKKVVLSLQTCCVSQAQAQVSPTPQQQAAPADASLPTAPSVDEDLMAALFPWMPPESPTGQVTSRRCNDRRRPDRTWNTANFC